MKLLEAPPHMILVDESLNHQLFRFHGKRWAMLTLVLGLAVIAVTAWLHLTHPSEVFLTSVLFGFGLLLLYSTGRSYIADQWLFVDGVRRTVKFHKKNLFGVLEWERPGHAFKELRVFRNGGDVSSWTIMLIDHEGMRLSIGEEEFDSLDHRCALALLLWMGRQ